MNPAPDCEWRPHRHRAGLSTIIVAGTLACTTDFHLSMALAKALLAQRGGIK